MGELLVEVALGSECTHNDAVGCELGDEALAQQGTVRLDAYVELGEHVLHVTAEDAAFNIIRVVAQILHWVFAVLFAFFTNKKWVFTSAEDDISTVNQLLRFSASRLATLGLDTLVTFATVWILQALDYHDVSLGFIGLDSVLISADLISKLMASVVVIITNYILSKIFVFRSKKESDTPQI